MSSNQSPSSLHKERIMRAAITILAILLSGIDALGVAQAAQPSVNALMQTEEVSLPNGQVVFPRGAGSELANAHCVICHSAGMVLRQPPLSFEEWKAEVNKMRAVYGAPLPPADIEDIARYLTAVNGRP
jgi:mono/diheme cytochrome c family protein